MLGSKAFSEAAILEVLKFIVAQAHSPARACIRFMLLFIESAGLCSADFAQRQIGGFAA